MRDFESLVSLAAAGIRERDSHPMPASVTSPEEFYKVMARAALDAIDLQSVLKRVAQTERDQKMIEKSLRRIEHSLRNGKSMPTVPMRAPDVVREMAVPNLIPSFALAGVRATRLLSTQPRTTWWKRRLLP